MSVGIWLLVVFVTGGSHGDAMALVTKEFQSNATCVAAGNAILKETTKGMQNYATASCTRIEK